MLSTGAELADSTNVKLTELVKRLEEFAATNEE